MEHAKEVDLHHSRAEAPLLLGRRRERRAERQVREAGAVLLREPLPCAHLAHVASEEPQPTAREPRREEVESHRVEGLVEDDAARRATATAAATAATAAAAATASTASAAFTCSAAEPAVDNV